ncbi:hypothetical protein ACHAW5_009069 [Stephanodiscus triporus]|uniref:Uncharacterized protein n=1 Tax=Stephanodiscus triporus TaxID=2934178 RepID=A0ABD3P661_9STRA
MTKFLPIVLSLLLAYASAQGCYSAYSPGTAYVAGSWVSASVSTITPYSWVACTPSVTCPTGWMQEGGVVTKSTHNFKCSTEAWCNNPAFAPGGIYSDSAWTKEANACSGTAVVPAPTPPPTPALWASGGCPEAYAANTRVAPGASVSVTKDGVSLVYTCTTDANSSFCPQAGYEPGTGTHWELAWTLSGSCTGSLSPTESPISSLPNQGGCPSLWTTSVEYRGGDKVSKNGMVFQCNAYPISLFCSQTGYEPLLASGIWESAWTALGPCTGTFEPTPSPTSAPTPEPTSSPTSEPTVAPTSAPTEYAYCTYKKIIVTTGAPVPCEYASSTDCLCTTVPVSVNPLGYACTKPKFLLNFGVLRPRTLPMMLFVLG